MTSAQALGVVCGQIADGANVWADNARELLAAADLSAEDRTNTLARVAEWHGGLVGQFAPWRC